MVTQKKKAGKRERKKHERVIHTRVPLALEKELKRFAENLRVPVSNLIRTILEDALVVAEQASHRVEHELLLRTSQLARGRDTLRRQLTRRIPRRLARS